MLRSKSTDSVLVEPTASLCSTILDLPPSCVEFSSKCPEYFVVGTYNLEKEDGPVEDPDDEQEGDSVVERKTQSRNGSLVLFSVIEDELSLIHTVTHPSAILDLHFSPYSPHLFAVASSTGSISLYELLETPRHGLLHRHTYQPFPESTLVLSLVWHPTFPDLLGCTLSSGTVALLQFASGYESLSLLRDDLSPHDGLEAWTLAFAPISSGINGGPSNPRSSPQSIYSGGDDSRLRCVTFTSIASLAHNASELSAQSIGGIKGMAGHGAGVTAILPLPLDTIAGQDILITGSYDDYVRVYATHDHRYTLEDTLPKALAELKIGGGVWRLKYLRDYALLPAPKLENLYAEEEAQVFRVLASCMHAGARILEIRGCKTSDWTIKVIASFEEHKSMNYGSDVQPITDLDNRFDDTKALCVSTSFYDRLLCVWKFGSTG